MDVVVLEPIDPVHVRPFLSLLQAFETAGFGAVGSHLRFRLLAPTLVDAVAGPAQRDVISAHAGPRILLVGRPVGSTTKTESNSSPLGPGGWWRRLPKLKSGSVSGSGSAPALIQTVESNQVQRVELPCAPLRDLSSFHLRSTSPLPRCAARRLRRLTAAFHSVRRQGHPRSTARPRTPGLGAERRAMERSVRYRETRARRRWWCTGWRSFPSGGVTGRTSVLDLTAVRRSRMRSSRGPSAAAPSRRFAARRQARRHRFGSAPLARSSSQTGTVRIRRYARAPRIRPPSVISALRWLESEARTVCRIVRGRDAASE